MSLFNQQPGGGGLYVDLGQSHRFNGTLVTVLTLTGGGGADLHREEELGQQIKKQMRGNEAFNGSID